MKGHECPQWAPGCLWPCPCLPSPHHTKGVIVELWLRLDKCRAPDAYLEKARGNLTQEIWREKQDKQPGRAANPLAHTHTCAHMQTHAPLCTHMGAHGHRHTCIHIGTHAGTHRHTCIHGHCYALNFCVLSPISYAETFNPQCDSIRRWGLWEVIKFRWGCDRGIFMKRLIPF